MGERRNKEESNTVTTLLNMIEQRFSIRLQTGSVEHLQEVENHYREKRELLLHKYGDVGVYTLKEYAKAFLISEAARMLILREIDPIPRKKKNNKKDRN